MPELHWLTRTTDLKAADQVPYRLLEEVPELSATHRDPNTENILIQGNNLETSSPSSPSTPDRPSASSSTSAPQHPQ